AIGDGALPSNEGRGYVLRRLLRRAIRFAKQLGIDKPFMYQLVETVGKIMVDHYPEVTEEQSLIERIIKQEEERFRETLDDGFQKEMEKQRERARDARQQVDSMQVQDDLLSEINARSKFIGYNKGKVTAKVEQIIKDHDSIDAATRGDEILLILSETPFYAESGGQVADKGWIYTDDLSLYVEDVKKAPKGQHIHQATVKRGTIRIGQEVTAMIDRDLRTAIIKNHTATHLLHQALKDV